MQTFDKSSDSFKCLRTLFGIVGGFNFCLDAFVEETENSLISKNDIEWN